MIKMRLILTSLLAGLLLPAFAQQTKVLTAEKHNEYGIVYSLPTTALQISFTARKETRKAGPYRQYAKRYLGTASVVEQDEVVWTITGIEVSPVGVRNDSRQYLMQLKAGALTYVGVDKNGMLLSINADPDEPDGLEPEGVSLTGTVLKQEPPVDDYIQYVDMDFVSAQNSMRQAEMVAGSLMEVREAYIDLTRGNAENMPTDGRQLELMLASLRQQEEALTRAFTGSVTVEEFTGSYLFTPEEEGEQVLLRMSDFAGFVDADDFSGSPVYVNTEIVVEGAIPVDAEGVEKKFPKDGVVYSIPGVARISVYTADQKLFSKEMEFSQFGTVFGLAPSLFTDKKAPSFAKFNPATGALEEIGKVAAEQ